MTGHRRGLVTIAATTLVVLLAAGCSSNAPGGKPSGSTPHTAPPSSASSSTTPAPRLIANVWPTGTNSAWVLTLARSGSGPQRVDRTADGGRRWIDVTPPGLVNATSARVLDQLFALDGRRAWLTYGPLRDDSPQTLLATADAGTTWTSLGRVPRTDCTVWFVDPTDGWCVFIGAAAGSEGVDLYRTTDGGRTWREVSRTDPNGRSTPGSLPFGCDKDLAFDTPSLG